MRSEVRLVPAFRDIFYAQAWEDPEVDAAALAIGPGDDVFAICASGDNALALLLSEPRSLVALDFNLSQCCLLELKMAALRALAYPELLELLGVRASRRRPELFAKVRPELSEQAQRFWDGRGAVLARGVIHAGRFERYFAVFRRAVLPLIHSQRTVRDLLACLTLEEQRSFYARRWDTRRWRLLFKVFFSRTVMGRLGRDPAMFKYVEDDVATAILQRAKHGLTETPAATNWFLEYIVTGRYTTPHRLPPYLRAGNQAKLADLLGRVTIVNDELERYLPSQEEGAFSKYYLSDVFEYMSEEAARALLGELWRTSRQGAVLSYREMMVPRPCPEALRGHFSEDRALGERCHLADRAFFYGAHRVLTAHKPPAGGAGS